MTPIGRAAPAFVVALLLLSAGCGFHLRGAPQEVALPSVQLQFERARTPLALALSGAVRDAAILTPTSAAPQFKVRISEQQEERRSRTLTRGIQVAEYELTVGLDFVVVDPSGNPLQPAQRLAASRVYAREQENLLTNEAEEDVLWNELRLDVAGQLVQALAAQLAHAAQAQPAQALQAQPAQNAQAPPARTAAPAPPESPGD